MDYLSVGDRQIAMEHRRGGAPGLFWLGGFRSEMTGAKATAIDAWGAARGLAVTRFDYSGHGQTGGDFDKGTITRWLEESLAVFETTAGPQIIIGSSMGGWLALLLAREHHRRGGDRISGMVLIAPATDMTETLIWEGFSKKQKKLIETQGFLDQPSDYGAPLRLTQQLIEDGRQHLLFGHAIETGCPVTILQGGKDRDVPKEHALRLVEHLLTDPVTFTLIPDGDHRLSRPEDLALLETVLERAVAEVPRDA